MWPSLMRRTHISAALGGEVTLALMLVVALTFSSRDGVPSGAYDYSIGPLRASNASSQVSGDNLDSSQPPQVAASRLVAMAPPAQVAIPTARPVQLLIAALDVHRPVEPVGVNRNGVMDLPANWWNAGWYQYGPVPGAPGDAVIEGHAGYPGQPLIFGKLATLSPGARIVVVLADGSRHLFLVNSMSTVPVGAAPPGFAEPYGVPRLTLITCTGHFDQNSYSYSARLVVEASYAGRV